MVEKRDVMFRNRLIRDGINTAVYETMKVDPMVYLIGEGMHMKVHYDAPQIEKEFPDRVVTWPIAEDSGVNFSLGASLLGVKPIYDVILGDFMLRVMDSVCNTCATTSHIIGKQASPIVIKGEFILQSPSTGQRLEAFFAHIPNLNVVIPSNQLDAYYLMLEALRGHQVIIFLEDRMIQDAKMNPYDKLNFHLDYVPYRRPMPPASIGKAVIRKHGERLTVVSYALTLQRAEEVLDEHPEWDVELIDLVTVKPFDKLAVVASALKTKRLLMIEPDIVAGGIGAEVVATMAELASVESTHIGVKRIGAPLETIPASLPLQDMFIPDKKRIESAIEEML